MFAKVTDDVKHKIAEDAKAMGGVDTLEAAARSDRRSAGAVHSLISRMRSGANGATPAHQPSLPPLTDLTPSGATSRAELKIHAEERDPLDPPTFARLVSAFATQKVIENIPSSVQKLRNVAMVLGNKAIEGYVLEEQLKKSLKEATTRVPI